MANPKSGTFLPPRSFALVSRFVLRTHWFYKGNDKGITPMGDNMGCSDFVLEDSQIAHDIKDARVSINVVSKDSPPTWPTHNADIIYSWCFSAM